MLTKLHHDPSKKKSDGSEAENQNEARSLPSLFFCELISLLSFSCELQ